MTHLRIELNNIPENVTTGIISKLYQYAKEIKDYEEANNIEVSLVSLKGNLSVPVCYRAEKTWLETKFPDLHIIASDYAIPFEDPNMLTYLNSIGVGSNGMITEALAAAATSVSNSVNTTVTKFNELRYFTNVTLSKGGFTGNLFGNCYFKGWTALEEVDISNFTSLGHSSSSGLEDTFCNCSSLKTVIASDKLTKIGHGAFRGCTNLEDVTGLSGNIGLGDYAFENCSKLTSDNFANCSIGFEKSNNLLLWLGTAAFRNCTALTTINLNEVSLIPNYAFSGCSNLSSVTGLGATVDVSGWTFENCVSLSNIGNTIVTNLGNSTFNGCTSLTSISIALSVNPGTGSWFNGCTSLSNVTCDWTNCPIVANYAFFNCSSLLTIDLTGVTEIKERAFGNCTALTTVTGASNIIQIGKRSFESCTKLELLTGLNTVSLFSDGDGYNFDNCQRLTFPNNFKISVNGNLNILGRGSFRNCLNLTSISFDQSVKGFLADAFSGCTSLSSLGTTTLYGITMLGRSCFSNCTSLTGELNFPDVTTMPDLESGVRGNLFYGCTGLTKITLGHLPRLANGPQSGSASCMFYNCTSLVTVDLGDSISGINHHNFNGCSALRNVIIRATTPPTLYDSLESIGSLFGNNNVTIYVPDAVVNDYLTASGWANHSGYILPLSNYQST